MGPRLRGDDTEVGEALCDLTSLRRHCERSEAIQKTAKQELDRFVATLLAMTEGLKKVDGRDKPGHDALKC
jgi:hypothetical protein